MIVQRLRAGQGWLPGLLIFGGTLLVSLLGSWIPSIWADEGATISASTRTLGQLAALVHNIDMVHGLYYALMNRWFELAPVDAFWLRFPSAVAVALAAVLLHRLARTWLEPGRAVLVAALFAVLPRVTWMGAEGRSWAFSTLVVVAMTLVVVRWSTARRPAWLVCYAALLAVGVALHLYVVFIAVAHAISLGVAWRRDLRRLLPWALAAALGFLSASPVWWIAWGQSAQVGGEKPGPMTWLRQAVVNEFFLGETPGPESTGALGLAWRGGSVGLALVAWGLVAVGLVAAARQPKGDALTRWSLPWLLIPSAAVLVWSLAGHNLYNPRYFGFCTPALALLLVRGVGGLRRRWLRVISVALIVVLAMPVYLSQRTPRAKEGADWAEVATWVATHAHPGDSVYFAPTPTTRTIAFAYPAAFAGLDDLTLVRAAPLDASLAGESAPLGAALTDRRPVTILAIWRIGAVGYGEDLAAFSAAGYRPAQTWTGSLHVVARLLRTG